MSIDTVKALGDFVTEPYKKNITQFLAAIQRGEENIRYMLRKDHKDLVLDIDAIKEDLQTQIGELIGPDDDDDQEGEEWKNV